MKLLRSLRARRRSILAVGAAVLAHVPLFVIGTRALPARPAATDPLPIDDYAIELFTPVELAPARGDENAGWSAETSSTTATTDAIAEHAGEMGSRSRPETPTAGASASEHPRSDGSANEPDLPATPSGSSAPVMLFVPSATALGMSGSGPNPFAVAAGPRVAEIPTTSRRSAAPDAPTAIEAKRAVEQSLRDGVRARDTDIGLGPEGPVLHALRDAAYAGLAPERGSATFLAVVDAGGIVVDLRLVSSNGNERGWSDARARAMRALGGKKLALRGARGAELVIAVDSDVRLPSGNKVDAPIRPTFSESKVVLPTNAPSTGVTSDVVHTHTLGTFDVADIAAKPLRVVHARLVTLTTL